MISCAIYYKRRVQKSYLEPPEMPLKKDKHAGFFFVYKKKPIVN